MSRFYNFALSQPPTFGWYFKSIYMEQVKIPQGHQTVMPYLIIRDGEGFISFTQTVFGATVTHKTMDENNQIRHAEVTIGNSTIMFGVASEQWPQEVAGMFVYVADTDEAYKKAMEAGATTIMPVEDRDYGRTCGVKDPNGNTWWITSVN